MPETPPAVVREPDVYLISHQTVVTPELDRFLANEGFQWDYSDRLPWPAELVVESAGRLCYLSFGTGRSDLTAYVNNILSSRHGSVLEHAVWGFIFTGISRSLTHELVRHRAGMAYSQLSQRYVDESRARFVMPPAIQGHPDEEAIWFKEVAEDLANYMARVERMMAWPEFQAIPSRTERRKMVREAARSNLPNATETMIFATGNARAWRNIIELRVSGHAEAEIRRLQYKVAQALLGEAPHIFGDYEFVALADGTFEAHTENVKV
ncbi:MAG: FAD-dependent thymidylate synthase [Dehalococcoidia bacterium]|nr:FAD-dependent thymidylate synthase [Dehalococcoidia bacterium]